MPEVPRESNSGRLVQPGEPRAGFDLPMAEDVSDLTAGDLLFLSNRFEADAERAKVQGQIPLGLVYAKAALLLLDISSGELEVTRK